jgi:hypothetical protein
MWSVGLTNLLLRSRHWSFAIILFTYWVSPMRRMVVTIDRYITIVTVVSFSFVNMCNMCNILYCWRHFYLFQIKWKPTLYVRRELFNSLLNRLFWKLTCFNFTSVISTLLVQEHVTHGSVDHCFIICSLLIITTTFSVNMLSRQYTILDRRPLRYWNPGSFPYKE